MPKILSYIEPMTASEQLRVKDGFELVQVLDVRRIGPDYQWRIVVARDVPNDFTQDANDA